jgi:L-alanine-DL-glutamate epimerase-like enolase superfamily enzyme
LKVSARVKSFELASPFVISRGPKSQAEVIEVKIEQDGAVGLGEGVPYPRYNETAAVVLEQISRLPARFNRHDLIELLPPGAARNAVDCALWGLESKLQNQPVWQLANLPEPKPLEMGETVSLGPAAEMLEAAARLSDVAVVKLKLGGQADAEVLAGIRAVAPAPKLIVDVNEGWSPAALSDLLPLIEAADVEILEQPLAASTDAFLASIKAKTMLCADESLHPGQNLAELTDRYQMVNIKLDKTGGLTAAIEQLSEARRLGLRVMVGCMASSSLSIAPAFLLGQLADLVDLDGFRLLAQDRADGLQAKAGKLLAANTGFWGA